MAVWLVRAGKYGQDESAALEKGYSIIGWLEIPDISKVTSYEAMKVLYAEHSPDQSQKTVINQAAQLWAFCSRIEIGDTVVLPLKTGSPAITIGKITGPYEFKDGRHMRKTQWVRSDIPRSDFGQDLLYSLGAFMTVCQIQRNNAENRIQAIMEGKKDPQLKTEEKNVTEGSSQGAEGGDFLVDLEEQAFDQIRTLIESRFKGHSLTRLVEAILNVEGYRTYRSPEGPDGGVDILAGHGPMGFDPPRICAQVKSGGKQSEIAIRELEGVISRLGAEQGLFVSWDGFNNVALKSIRDLFFRVRLWDSKQLMSVLLKNYDNLPDEIQAELPLKRIWVVVPEGE